jgi:site-specific DNA-methyltransferase (adenine-specific)/adenine-specific DNA-methyltransferase
MPTLNWIGKEAVVNHHHHVPFRLLKDVTELACGDTGTGNLIVEGDNLEALKALLPYYAGQVKCIYIDPPYNTGNEGWVYNDNVRSPTIEEWLGKTVGKEGETLDRHDRWLCMMYPRLALLREFLSEDGSIWISLDDNEIQALRYVMDEIFGAGNFVSSISWQKIYTVKNSARHFSEMHDYVAVYAQNAKVWAPNLLSRSSEQDDAYKNPDKDPRGPWKATPLHARNFYSQGLYSIHCPGGRVIEGPPKGTYWRYPEISFLKLATDNAIWWGKDGNGVPSQKRFLTDVKQGVVPATMWMHGDAGHNAEAKNELRDVLSEESEMFITPKPTRLIERILQIATNPGDLILDSFAGSGTTGHAVLKMNRSEAVPPASETDSGQDAHAPLADRRFILVEMEPEIAPKITAERVRRVADGYTNAKGEEVPGLGGGFRYCRLGEPLFDAERQIRPSVTFGELARHVYFTETGEPLPRERVPNTPLLGVCRGVAIYLLYNGILGDKSTNGGNVLTRSILSKLPKFHGQKVIYCAGCLIGTERRNAERIIIRQTPYEIKVS